MIQKVRKKEIYMFLINSKFAPLGELISEINLHCKHTLEVCTGPDFSVKARPGQARMATISARPGPARERN